MESQNFTASPSRISHRSGSFHAEGNVLAYIDNSNIFINTQMHAATLQKFKFGVKQDWRARVDVGKLLNLAKKGRELLRGKLYGSEPPALDTVWKAIRNHRIEVSHSKRSTWNAREKKTDTELTANAVEDIIEYKGQIGVNSSVVLFTGDEDMIPVVRAALKHGWQVEIWSYRKSLNQSMKQEETKSPKVKIFYMDDYFEIIVYWAYYWRKRLPRDRTIVLRLWRNPDPKAYLKTAIERSTAKLQQPTMGYYLDENLTLAIVPLLQQLNKIEGNIKYDFNKNVWGHEGCGAKALKDSLPDCEEILTYVQYLQEIGEDEYELLEDPEGTADPDEETEMYDSEFIPVVKKQRKPKQIYSDPCKWRFRCANGLACTSKHSDLEKAYFKEQPNHKFRVGYKTKICYHFDKQTCRHMGNPHLCSYAHGIIEARCINCEEVGVHWTDECPVYN